MLQLLVALLVALQLAGPAHAISGEGPPVPASHADHLGTQGEAGCEPLHDEAACLSCRIMSLQPLHPQSAPALPALATARELSARDFRGGLPSAPGTTPLQARAPPRI